MDHDPSERADRLAAFSTWLARERELRGFSRDAVLRATRLAPAVVDALEAGEASRWPPRAYAVGYLRAYAGALGLDPDDVVLRYEEAAGGEEQASPPGPLSTADAVERGRGEAKLLPWIAAAVAIAVAGGGALWVWLQR